MATYVTDDGICLRVVDFSETSQIVGMFTRGHGLVPLIAKGAKRASKKNVMSGPLDLLTSGEVVFVPARVGQVRPLDLPIDDVTAAGTEGAQRQVAVKRRGHAFLSMPAASQWRGA